MVTSILASHSSPKRPKSPKEPTPSPAPPIPKDDPFPYDDDDDDFGHTPKIHHDAVELNRRR